MASSAAITATATADNHEDSLEEHEEGEARSGPLPRRPGCRLVIVGDVHDAWSPRDEAALRSLEPDMVGEKSNARCKALNAWWMWSGV